MMLVSSLLQDILSLLVTLLKYYLAHSKAVTHHRNEYKLKRVPSSQIPMTIVCKIKELFSSINQQNYSGFHNSGCNSVLCGGSG